MPTRQSLCRSGTSSRNIRRSSSRCPLTRPISTSRKTSRASSWGRKSRKKSGLKSAPKPSSRRRPESPTTNSSPSSLPTTASRTGCSSSPPKWARRFVETLPVRKFHGVGPATARKMSALGIETGFDLKGQTLDFLQQHFGKVSSYYYWAARGVDERPVRADRIRKSVGAENTFPTDLFAHEAARDALREIVEKVWDYCEGSGIRGRTVTLKVKFANFRIITRSRTGQD